MKTSNSFYSLGTFLFALDKTQSLLAWSGRRRCGSRMWHFIF